LDIKYLVKYNQKDLLVLQNKFCDCNKIIFTKLFCNGHKSFCDCHKSIFAVYAIYMQSFIKIGAVVFELSCGQTDRRKAGRNITS